MRLNLFKSVAGGTIGSSVTTLKMLCIKSGGWPTSPNGEGEGDCGSVDREIGLISDKVPE